MNINISLNISPSNEDIEEVLGWLKNEYEETGEGFYNNKELILDAYDSGNVICYKLSGECVGLVVYEKSNFHVNINIFVIKPTYRKKNIGADFYSELKFFFQMNGFYLIKLYCRPIESFAFWSALGFLEFPDYSKAEHSHSYYDSLVPGNLEGLTHGPYLIELWCKDFYKVDFENDIPNLVWSFSSDIVMEQYAIIQPCNYNWAIRLSKNGLTLKESKIKYFTDEDFEIYESGFLCIPHSTLAFLVQDY